MNKKLVNLKDNGILVPKVLGGIDVNNVIATITISKRSGDTLNYTATEDCYVVADNVGGNFWFYLNIDGVLVNQEHTSYIAKRCLFYLKKGQTITTTGSYGTIDSDFIYKFYGLKY